MKVAFVSSGVTVLALWATTNAVQIWYVCYRDNNSVIYLL